MKNLRKQIQKTKTDIYTLKDEIVAEIKSFVTRNGVPNKRTGEIQVTIDRANDDDRDELGELTAVVEIDRHCGYLGNKQIDTISIDKNGDVWIQTENANWEKLHCLEFIEVASVYELFKALEEDSLDYATIQDGIVRYRES